MHRWAIPLLCLDAALAAVCWAVAPAWVAVTVAIGVVLGGWLVGGLLPAPRPGRRLAVQALAAALLCVIGLIPDLWNCDSCVRLDGFKYLWGIDLLWFALAAYVVLAGMAWCSDGRRRLALIVYLGAWACIGSSVYFCYLLWQLEAWCTHCLAVHTVVLAFPASLLRQPPGWPARLAAIALAFCALHVVQHPHRPPDAAELAAEIDRQHATGDGWTTAELTDLLAADRGRRHGDPGAPWRAELVIDYTCPHCRDAYPALRRLLWQAVDDGRLHLIVRHSAGPERATAERLALLGYAAAIIGRHRDYLPRLLGHKADVPVQLPSSLPGEQLRRMVDEWSTRPLRRLYDLDRVRLRRIGGDKGSTPQLFLYAHGDRDPHRRWRGEIPAHEVGAVIGD